MARVDVDVKAIGALQKDLTVARFLSLGRLGERGRKHLTDEVPYKTGNLRQGVGAPDIDKEKMTATLTVSARSAQVGSRPATVHYPSGKTKQISLRPQLPFNYAEVVAEGRPAIMPKLGKALLIPVISVSAGETYITSGDQMFVVRTSAAAVKPNPFDERAAAKLEKEAPSIVEHVFGELFA